MPFRLFLLRAACVVPRATSRERERRNAVPTCRRANLRIISEVPDQTHFVKAPAHISSWRESRSSPRTMSSDRWLRTIDFPLLVQFARRSSSRLARSRTRLRPCLAIDTPAEHDRILRGPPVVSPSPSDLDEGTGIVQGTGS